jgi:hypothetical protein
VDVRETVEVHLQTVAEARRYFETWSRIRPAVPIEFRVEPMDSSISGPTGGHS